MKVRTLIGKDYGQIKEMPFHVAQACLANGTAIHPDAPMPVVRGAPKIVVETVEEAVEEVAVDRMVRPAEIQTKRGRRRRK